MIPVVLPVVVYGVVLLSYYRRLRPTMPLPDYGDLWRMSVQYSVDGRLEASEPFVEAQPFAHIPVLHAALNHIAITQADYSVLWLVGAFAAVATGWLVGAGTVSTLAGTDRRPVGILAAALVGVLAFRFDVQNVVTKSMLLESQVLFLQGTLAIAVAARFAVVRNDRVTATSDPAPSLGSRRRLTPLPANESVLLVALLVLLVIGDAPTAVLSVAMIGISITIGLLARGPLDTTFRILGVIALVALATRWVGLRSLGARGGPGSVGEIDVMTTIVDVLKLVGAGFVNLSAMFEATQPAYDFIHIAVAGLLLPLWGFTVFRLWRRSDPSRADVGLAVCLTLALAFIAVSAVATSVIRGVGNNHQASRAVRSTALVAPATLVALYQLLQTTPRLARRAAAITLLAGLSLLTMRGVAFVNSYERIGGVVRYRERNAAIICERPPAEDRWRLMWSGFREASIEAALASEHLEFARRAGCEDLTSSGESAGEVSG